MQEFFANVRNQELLTAEIAKKAAKDAAKSSI